MSKVYITAGIFALLLILGFVLNILDDITDLKVPEAVSLAGLLLSIISVCVLIGSGIVLGTATECSDCESLSPIKAHYCIHCGEELETPEALLKYYCSNCGKEVSGDYTFCPDCGNEIIIGRYE